jgi:anthranilate synthase component 2
MKILVLDNYDSFTYNLVQLLRELTDYRIDVRRNDEITQDEVVQYSKILLSPGPGIPAEAGIMNELIKEYASSKSILGICLGMQGIAEVFGCKLHNLESVFHGKVGLVKKTSNDERLFRQLPDEFEAGRYHSWAVESIDIPDSIHVTAVDETGIIMALAHKDYDVKGVQFHPESVMTPYGKQILSNWIDGETTSLQLASPDSQLFDLNNLSSPNLFC